MKNIEKCIQLKIDQLISNINRKKENNDNQQEESNEVTILISYSHCLDLFDFLQNYSKVQKNELLFQISLIYNILGYNQLSLEYTNESLLVIPNVPTIILFKSVLYASMNRLEEAQKYLLKFKYLIGEDIFYNYIYNSIRILFFYLLEYEENIILREINILEEKYPKYFYNNTFLFYIKSKLFSRLSEKFKQVNKKRSYIYKKDSIQNKEKAYNSKKLDAEYLSKYDIHKENAIKLLMMIYPNCLEYKPKPLIDYHNNFHSGFGLFFTLFKLCKIFIFKINIIKYKKISKYKHESKSNNFSKENSLDYILNTIQNDSTNIENSNCVNNNAKECQNKILGLSKSAFLEDYISSKNNNVNINSNNRNNSLSRINSNRNNNKKIKEKKCIEELINMKNANDMIKTNYFIYRGFYSNLNLKESILKNINFNNEYKEKILGKDSLLDETNEDFNNNIIENKIKNRSKDNILSSKQNNFEKKNENLILNNKLKNDEKNKNKNNYKSNIIQPTQSKHYLNANNYKYKEKIIKVNVNPQKATSGNKYHIKKSTEKEKNKIINLNINSNITVRNSKRNSKDSNNNKNNYASYKNLNNNNDINNYKKDKNNAEIKKIDKYNKDNKENKENKESKESNMNNLANNINFKKEKEKSETVDNNKLNDNQKQLIKKTKNANSVNNIFNNIIIFGSNNMYLSRNNTKSCINNEKEKTNQNQNQKHNNKELTIVHEIEKKPETNTNDNCINYTNNKDYKNNNLNENNKLYVYKINNLNNINYDIQSQNKKIINKTNNSEKEGRNEKMKDIGEYFMKKIEKKENSKKYKKRKNLEKINQTEKIKDNKISKMEKMTFMKSSINKSLKKKKLVKNYSKYLKKDNKTNLTSERSPYNTISLKEPNKEKLTNNNPKKKYMNCQNINKILNKNMHNKIKTYLEFRPVKENSKSENKKRAELTLREKINFLTINLDLLTKSKVGTPTYQKISLFGSFRSDSKDKKSENMNKIRLSKLSINSPNYTIRLKRKFKDNKSKLNYNGPKSSFNKYLNNNLVKKSTYYFNNIMNVSEFHKNKNISSNKLKHSSTNKSISKNNIKTKV